MSDPRDEIVEQIGRGPYDEYRDQQIQELLSRALLNPPSDPPEEKM